MNILILSAGTRDKIVQYMKKAVGENGKVVATDCSNLAPAIYEADIHYLLPKITAPGYIDMVLEICKKEKIDGVFSLIDPELSLLAKEKDRFLEIGTTPIVSSFSLCETCLDKYEMYQLLNGMHIKTAKSYIKKEEFLSDLNQGKISFPVFVKPRKGSASIHINMVNNEDELDMLLMMHEDLMIQEYMRGDEYGADVYIDMNNHKCTSIFIKKKIRMRAGETDKSVSVKDEKLFDLIKNFVEQCGFEGMIDMDIFRNGEDYYISEVNPRFGGGYPHAYEAGVDMPKQIVNNLAGNCNKNTIGEYKIGVCMMKYNEIMIKDIAESEIVMM